MNKKIIWISLTAVIVCACLFAFFRFADNYFYELNESIDDLYYNDDYDRIVKVPNTDDVLIVRVYEGLFANRITVYYKRPNSRKILLGSVSTDEGLEPQYSCFAHDNTATIHYKYRHNDFREKTFEYPEEKWYEKIFG